jgi:hypothetical protein
MGFGNYPGTGGELEVGTGRREEAEKRLCVGGVVGEHGGVSWVWHDVADDAAGLARAVSGGLIRLRNLAQ